MGYSAIDPDVMATMISSLSTGANTLQDTGSLKARCAFWGVGEQFAQISAIGDWVEGELPMLRRRLNLARALETQAGTDSFVQVLEPPELTAEEAARIGRELATRLASHNRTDEEGARLFHEIALELQKYQNDPDVMSAFYGKLGRQYTQLIPSLMSASGSDTAAEDLQIYSRALGVAMDDVDPPAEFTQVTSAFTRPTEDGEIVPAASWGRLAMVQYGDFPPDWLTKVVRVNALDAFAEDPNRDFRGGSVFEMQATGLSEDVVALAFSALGNNPEAARSSLRTMGEPDHPISMADLVDVVYGYAKHVGTGQDVADGFGLAIESGAGVHDETAGDHSTAASRFAFDFILASADHPDPPWLIKDSLSKVAGSYTHELAASSSPLDKKSSAFGYSDAAIQGLDPRFTLDPRVVYGFVRGFAGDDQFTAPFDQAMGQVYMNSLIAAAQADQQAIAAGKANPENFETVNQYFGGLAGIEYEAKEQVRGDMDEADERVRGIVKDLVTFPLNFVPGDQVLVKGAQISAKGAQFLWELAQYGVDKGLDAKLDVAPTDTRVGQLENAENRLVLARQYVVAQALLDAKYPVSEMPASVGSNGRLKPFNEIDPAAFEAWIESNSGPGSFENKMEQGTLIFLGGSKFGEEVAAGYE
jgi:hypothetical protein